MPDPSIFISILFLSFRIHRFAPRSGSNLSLATRKLESWNFNIYMYFFSLPFFQIQDFITQVRYEIVQLSDRYRLPFLQTILLAFESDFRRIVFSELKFPALNLCCHFSHVRYNVLSQYKSFSLIFPKLERKKSKHCSKLLHRTGNS